jgi:hypothetical protein
VKIIDTQILFQNFIQEESQLVHFIIPIYCSEFKSIHENKISLLYVYCIDSSNEYILCYNHSEAECLPIQTLTDYLNSQRKIFCFNKKKLLQYSQSNNLIDIDLVQWFYSNTYLDQDYDTPTHDQFYRTYENLSDINIVIPIGKHYDKCKQIREQFFNVLDYFDDQTYTLSESYDYYDFILRTLYNIEKSGMYVDHKLFNKHFEEKFYENKLVYTEYNIYTTTGRPSNRFNGINYAALNKEDGSRASFISRFKNGILVQFDYDAYHLRLLADLIDYKFPEGISVHEYLGKIYFEKDTLTDAEYQESKQISFKLLYGGITKDYLSIDFFAKIKQYTDLLFEKFNEDGYLESPIAGRKLYKKFFKDINASKLLNYFIQIYETERNILIISRIDEQLQNNKDKLILYTYDSFLFDLNVYNKDLIRQIRDTLESNNKFPVKLTKGITYHDVE